MRHLRAARIFVVHLGIIPTYFDDGDASAITTATLVDGESEDGKQEEDRKPIRRGVGFLPSRRFTQD